MRLRSVELAVPRVREAAEFLQTLWGLIPAGTRGRTQFFRGTGAHPYILAIEEAEAPAVHAIGFSGSPEEIDAVRERARRANAPVKTFAALDAPGGGSGFLLQGPEAQVYRFIAEAEPPAALPSERDKPIQITHAVMNAVDVSACERFVMDVLGFKVSDRTRVMTFVRCNRAHHALAFAHSDVPSLNHIAFEMNDCDGVMRGIGRMKDAGFEAVWGPGRHGPGNNVFGYFIAPFGAVIEYTAEVLQVTDDYRVGGPEDWKWPPGRIDQWGVSRKDTARIAAAERTFRFPAAASG
jgi:catechol 2,3-dioxygenase-like lactoylglutathione lyase family enzyme